MLDVDRHYKNILRRGWTVQENGCWHYNAKSNNGRYYRVFADYRHKQAHRVMLAISIGRDLMPYPDEMALHTCNNNLCINPDHLFVGDYWENNQDTQRKLGIDYFTCRSGHDVSDPGNIKIGTSKGREYRSCKICSNMRSNESMSRKYWRDKDGK